MTPSRHRVVVLGGGFGGLSAVRALRRTDVDITLIDRRNFHLFQPLLYQVAAGSLSPANIASPLRSLLRKQRNTQVMLAEVVDIDVPGKRVLLENGRDLAYDTLVVATGARHHYFGHPEWEALAPGLKTLEDATEVRRRVLRAFEAAEFEPDPAKRQALLTFVVVGGGPTGVELAGTFGELARATLRRDFRNYDPSTARIILLEGLDRVLSSFPAKLSERTRQDLNNLGVTVQTGALVTDIRTNGVTYQAGGKVHEIATHNVLWAAGVAASPLGAILAKACGLTPDRAGRVAVSPDLTLAGRPEVFVVGDLASAFNQAGKPLPGVAPVAMQQGRYVAAVIQARRTGDDLPPPFQYHDKGNMATIGRSRAVADLGFAQIGGFFAWATWLTIHLLYIVTFQNRLLVVIQWSWNYFTRNRSARLITGEDVPPPPPTTVK